MVLDIRVLANDSIVIDTSLARVALGTNLRVAGPISRIRLTGQADIAPGGQLFFGGHTYQIESGIFDFRAATLRPDARLVAHTTIGGYEITMRVESREGNIETTLTSDPPLPEDEVASLMLSGQRTTTGSAGEVVTAQLMQALSGEIVGTVGRAIGFDAVRVESGNPADLLLDPTLLSNTTNPAQRITFSKRVFPNLEVIFSQSLRDSADITYVVAYEPFQHFEFRFAQLDNRDKSYEVRNDLSFGGGRTTADFSRRRPTEVVRDVYVAVFGGITEDEVRHQLRITEGRHFDFYKWQRDRDRLQKLFVERGFFEARLTARRDPPAPSKPQPGQLAPVDLGYTIETGPPTELRITGMDLPDDVRRMLIQLWQDTPVDSLLGDEFTSQLRPWLADHGYLRPTIATTITRDGEKKIAAIAITPGEKYDTRVPVFTGNQRARRARARARHRGGTHRRADVVGAEPGRAGSCGRLSHPRLQERQGHRRRAAAARRPRRAPRDDCGRADLSHRGSRREGAARCQPGGGGSRAAVEAGRCVHRQPRRRRDSSDADAFSPRRLSRHASGGAEHAAKGRSLHHRPRLQRDPRPAADDWRREDCRRHRQPRAAGDAPAADCVRPARAARRSQPRPRAHLRHRRLQIG